MIDIPVTIQKEPEHVDLDITVSQAAIDKIKELMENEEGMEHSFLRVHLQGGGCAGFQYGFMFDDDLNDTDQYVITDGVKVVVDSAFVPMLNGSIVDYQSSLTGSQFIISNPNATSTCGCGSSFSCG